MIFTCIGLAGQPLLRLLIYRKKLSRKNEKIVPIRTNCSCLSTSRFTQSGALPINPVCPPQDGFAVGNWVPRIYLIHFSRSIVGARRLIMGPANSWVIRLLIFAGAVRICTDICVGSSDCLSNFSVSTKFQPQDVNRLQESGSATAKSPPSAWVFAIGSPCTDLR